MNLQIPSFPMAGSAQVVGGSLRQKVALKPGRSLMDWIRLGNSGQDLTSVGGQPQRVTRQELAKHNKPDDIWMCVRGIVYNITPYMEYHPGGEDELMRAAGKDGTKLFDEIHRWVNIESMLAKCLVGKLVTTPSIGSREGSTSSRTSLISTNGLLAPAVPTASIKMPEGKPSPRYEWLQTETSITIVIYTKWSGIYEDHVIIDKEQDNFKLTVMVQDHLYIVHIELYKPIKNDFKVKASRPSGKVEVTVSKETSGQWLSLGATLTLDNSWKKVTESETAYRSCTIASISEVTHDTNLYCVQLPETCRMRIPPGFHVHLNKDVEGMAITRSYTVVPPSLISKEDASVSEGAAFYLMIKIYPGGALTPQIGKLQPGDEIEVSNHEGTFSRQKLRDATHVAMLAAGTGFTPMAAVIYHAIHVEPNPNRKLKLLFFNKREKDILWRDQLDTLVNSYENFSVTYILSEPDDTWQGHKGRINAELMGSETTKPSEDTKVLVCACGPTAFTQEAVRLAKEIGHTEDWIHAFLA